MISIARGGRASARDRKIPITVARTSLSRVPGGTLLNSACRNCATRGFLRADSGQPITIAPWHDRSHNDDPCKPSLRMGAVIRTVQPLNLAGGDTTAQSVVFNTVRS